MTNRIKNHELLVASDCSVIVVCYSGASSNLAVGLKSIGLSDIQKVVRLMSLVNAGRVELARKPVPSNDGVSSGSQVLQTLSAGVTALADQDPEASGLVLNMCTKVWMDFWLVC